MYIMELELIIIVTAVGFLFLILILSSVVTTTLARLMENKSEARYMVQI